MRPPVLEETKQEVIRLSLLGYGRDEIARLAKISHGTTTNIIEKWKNDIGKPEAEAVRELAKSIRAAGLTPALCVTGLRISNLMKRLGVKEDDYEQFLSEIYKKCENRRIIPEKIALHIEDLARFSDDTRLPEIEEYISQKLSELMAHNDRKQGLVYDISKLQGQKLQIERDRDEILAKKNEIGEEIENHHKVIQQLNSYGLDMTDFRGFAKVIQGMKELGFDTLKIASDVNEAANFKRDKDQKLAELQETNRKFDHIRRSYQSLQIAVDLHLQRLSIYTEFELLGIDARKLKILFDTVKNVSTANGLKFSEAFDKFLEDVCRQYDAKLGFEKGIKFLEAKFRRLSEEE